MIRKGIRKINDKRRLIHNWIYADMNRAAAYELKVKKYKRPTQLLIAIAAGTAAYILFA